MAETLQRTLSLLNLLQSRPVWTGTELARELGVTTRSIRRDVERLRELGYPIRATQGVGGGYQLGAGRALPPLLLDDGEAVAVAISLRLAAGGSVAGVSEAALRALAKLDQVLPARLRGAVEAVSLSTVSLDQRHGAGPEAVAPELLLELARAIRTPERISFGYRKAGHATADSATAAGRRVEPYRLVSAGRRWYLMAWDLDREDWRSFRLDRMGGLRATGWRFTPRPAPDAAQYIQTSISRSPYAHEARIRIHAGADVVRARVPATAAAIEPDGPDSCILAAGANALELIAFHVAMLGFDAEVLEPAQLRDVLGQLATRMQRMAAEPRPAG
jgi:predicted DNA-binding transcriptional regulator YafY